MVNLLSVISMDVFGEVNIDDKVLFIQRVNYGYLRKSFMTCFKVIKTSKTQFVLDNNVRIRKNDGRAIGSKLYSYERATPYKLELDETSKCEEFVKKVSIMRSLSQKITLIDRGISELTQKDIDISLIESLNKALDAVVSKIGDK